jgi:hypothetical protein
MTANVEVAGSLGRRAPRSRASGEPSQPRPTSRQRDVILIMILLAAAALSAQQADPAGAVISRGPGEPLQPRPSSRQGQAILIVIVLAAAANLAQGAAVFVIALAAIRGLVRDNQLIPRLLSWYFGSPPAWYMRRRNQRRLGQQGSTAPSG